MLIAPSHESLVSAWPVKIQIIWDPNGLVSKVTKPAVLFRGRPFLKIWKQIQMNIQGRAKV